MAKDRQTEPLAPGVVPVTGYVPIPFYYADKLKFEFLHFDDATRMRSFVEQGPDGYQMLFGTPLTEAQVNKLE